MPKNAIRKFSSFVTVGSSTVLSHVYESLPVKSDIWYEVEMIPKRVSSFIVDNMCTDVNFHMEERKYKCDEGQSYIFSVFLRGEGKKFHRLKNK